jgi:uncharacterized protein (DUF1501 family)
LQSLAEGVAALKQALVELKRWDSTLVATYSEFGRRPRENLSGGTDHGTASVHFLTGGRVEADLYGIPPALDRLDGNGNLPFRRRLPRDLCDGPRALVGSIRSGRSRASLVLLDVLST